MVEFKTLSYEAVTVGEEFMSLAFTKPVLAGDTLTVRGRIKSREPEGGRTRVRVDVWCENQEGVMTMAGTASGLESDLRAFV